MFLVILPIYIGFTVADHNDDCRLKNAIHIRPASKASRKHDTILLEYIYRAMEIAHFQTAIRSLRSTNDLPCIVVECY